ncbi:hypothetical protein J6590_063441 [Homalodisca vitripennis]|nr:hypothetical protein J6590_063441 [Homalodisca vitripennis]
MEELQPQSSIRVLAISTAFSPRAGLHDAATDQSAGHRRNEVQAHLVILWPSTAILAVKDMDCQSSEVISMTSSSFYCIYGDAEEKYCTVTGQCSAVYDEVIETKSTPPHSEMAFVNEAKKTSSRVNDSVVRCNSAPGWLKFLLALLLLALLSALSSFSGVYFVNVLDDTSD